MSKPSKTYWVTKGRFTLHWNCCEDSRKCRRRFKLFVGLFVDLLDSLKQGTTGIWILMTQMLAPGNSAWVCRLCLCSGHYTVKHGWMHELYGNELVFAFSFVSSNNTDVETTEQFNLLHTRYVCENIYIALCLLLRFSCFWPTMNSLMPSKERSFTLLISKVSYRTDYPKKLFPWPPVCLLASEKVVSFFICEEC